MRRVLNLAIIGLVALLVLSISSSTNVSAEGEIVVIRGDEVPLSARLLQNGTYGDPVPDQVISFYDALLDSYLGSALTNQDGYASIMWNIPPNHPLGITPMNATFSGNETLALAPSCQWAFVHVLSRTQIIIEDYSETIHPEDYFVLEISLLDDTNEPIVGARVSLFTATSELASTVTNETGHASFAFQCNLTWSSLGVNDLWVRFNQNLISYDSESEISLQYVTEQVESVINIETAVPASVNLTDSIEFHFHAETYEGAIPNSSLDIFLNNVFYDSVATNQYGEATLTIFIDSEFPLGPNTLHINYIGTDRNAPTYVDISFEVTSPIHLNFEVPEKVILGIDNQFKIEVSDILGRHIPNSIINMYDFLSNDEISKEVPPGLTSVDLLLAFDDSSGPRTLGITVTGNNYITNTTYSVNIIVWSYSEIMLIANSILGYASPSQEISFEVQINDYNGPIPERLVELEGSQNETIEILTTDSEGHVQIHLTAPATEGTYTYTVSYEGTESQFELPAKLLYQLIVTKVMPVLIQLERCEVIPAAQEIIADFIVQGLNGTYLKGVGFIYIWDAFTVRAITKENGFISIHLPIPGFGTHILYYHTEAQPTLASCHGNMTIAISETDALAAQGVGMPGLTLSVLLSITIVSVPIIHRRYVVG